MMGAEWVSPWEEMCRQIDREMLDDLRSLIRSHGENDLIGFFCAVGPAAAAVLEDMALEGRVWPGCEPSLRDFYRKARSKRRKAKRRSRR